MVYKDKNGEILNDGDTIRWDTGHIEKIALSDKGELGTDATSKSWIKKGLAVPFEFGIYPLAEEDLKHITRVVK